MTSGQQWSVVGAIVAVLGGALWFGSYALKDELVGVDVGTTAPNFGGATIVAPVKAKSLADYKGKVVLMNVWATWCGPCRTEMPEIEAFFQKYRNRGVDVVAVSLDDRRESAAVRRFMAPFSVPVALAADSDLRGFGRIRYLPATFVIDRDGLLKRSGWQQPASVDLPELEKALSPLLDAPADSPVVRSGG